MYDEEKMKGLRTIVSLVLVILMVVTVVLQVVAFDALRHVILCSCVLLLITVSLVFDGILKDGKNLFTHSAWYALWFFNVIMNLFKF